MKFTNPLIEGVLLRRYKRFLADVQLTTGETITAHTANTGSMTGCSEPGSRVWLSLSDNSKRKYAHSWEIVEVNGSVKVGINTLLPNRLVEEGIGNGVVKELQEYESIKREVKYGSENSRVDLLLQKNENSVSPHDLCYVEVKNVTLVDKETAYFPDAVSARGTRHLRELQSMVQQGSRAVIFYCLQRNDANEVKPADHIDPDYGQALRSAVTAGVEAIAYFARVTEQEISLMSALPVSIE